MFIILYVSLHAICFEIITAVLNIVSLPTALTFNLLVLTLYYSRLMLFFEIKQRAVFQVVFLWFPVHVSLYAVFTETYQYRSVFLRF